MTYQWPSQGFEVGWAKEIGGPKSSSGVQGRVPIGSGAKPPEAIRTLSAADERIFQADKTLIIA